MTTTEIIQELKSLDLAKYPYVRVRNLLCDLKCGGFMNYILPVGWQIVRARIGSNYTRLSSISYPPFHPIQNVNGQIYLLVVYFMALFAMTI
jgi:hypothetical protein